MGGLTMRVGRRGLAAAVIVVALSDSEPTLRAQGPTIEGVWALTVTLRDCATAASLGAAFRTILTFHQDGTITESSANPASAPGQRTLGHGMWRQSGPATYSNKYLAAILFDTPPNPPTSPGFRAGWQTGTQTAVLSDADHLTTTGQIYFYDLSRQLYRTVCASSNGERFK